MFYTIETSCTTRDVIHDNLLIPTFCFSFLLNTFYFTLFFIFNLPPKGREHNLRVVIFWGIHEEIVATSYFSIPLNPTGQTPCTSTGWFGEDCKYQCHCVGGADCDKDTGSCGSVGCHSDWFGPACQYGKSVEIRTSLNTPVFIKLAWR